MATASWTAALFFASCSPGPPEGPAPPESEPAVPIPIDQVVDRHAPELMKVPGVNAVFVGALESGEPCIKVGFVSRPHENESRIPAMLEGWPVVIEEVGEIRPRND